MKLLSALFLGVLCMSTVNATEQKKEAAQQYVVEVDKAVRLFMPTINSGDGVKIRNLSLKMNELVEKGEPLGPSTFDLPFGYCSAMEAWPVTCGQPLCFLKVVLMIKDELNLPKKCF